MNPMLSIRSSKQMKLSRFDLNSSVKQPFRGESLLENQKINWEGVILDQKIEISELQPSIQPALQGQMQVDTLTGNVETRKTGNPEIRIIRKSANLKSIRSRRQSQQLGTAAFVSGVFSTLKHVKDKTFQTGVAV